MSSLSARGIPRGKIRHWDVCLVSRRVEFGQVGCAGTAFVTSKRSRAPRLALPLEPAPLNADLSYPWWSRRPASGAASLSAAGARRRKFGEAGELTEGTPSADRDALEAAIARLERGGRSSSIRQAVSGLQELGCGLRPARTRNPDKTPENYLRIMRPTTKVGFGYLTPTRFEFDAARDRDRLVHLPGAVPTKVRVTFLHVESAHDGLEAVRLITERPDPARS
jgi:hypothetical protein